MKNKQIQYKIVIKRHKYMSKQLYNVVLCEEKSEKIRHKVGSIVVKNDKYLLYLNFELLKDF